MIVHGTLAVWLNIMAIAVIVFTLANIAVSMIVSLLTQRFFALEVDSRKSVLWLLALVPWLASFLVALYFGYSSVSNWPINLNNDYAHWHHINAFTLLSWHSLTLLVAATGLLYVLIKNITKLLKHNEELANLQNFAKPLGNDCYELDVPQASAFTSGLFNRRCYITTGMIEQTTSQEQSVIMRHEKAHADNHDPLKKWLFSLLAASFIPSIGARLKLHMTLAMEQSADNAVLNHSMPPTLVAATLVKVAKLNAATTPLIDHEIVASFGADVLEQRVYFLLGQLQLKPVNKLLSLMFFILILLLCLTSIDGVHHFIETIFSH